MNNVILIDFLLWKKSILLAYGKSRNLPEIPEECT